MCLLKANKNGKKGRENAPARKKKERKRKKKEHARHWQSSNKQTKRKGAKRRAPRHGPNQTAAKFCSVPPLPWWQATVPKRGEGLGTRRADAQAFSNRCTEANLLKGKPKAKRIHMQTAAEGAMKVPCTSYKKERGYPSQKIYVSNTPHA